jgi:hypothetical protein
MASTFIADFPPSLGTAAAAGEHYMLIDSYESLNAVSTGETKLSSIGLYIPAGSLNTTHTGNYEGKDGAATAANIGRGLGVSGGSPNDRSTSGSFDLGKLATGLIEKTSKALVGTADQNGFISAQGSAPNNYMALVYRGPNTFRQHTFAFKFFPKNKDESERVEAIIEEFRRGTLPRMSNGGGYGLKDSFFKSPRHHKITFCKGGSGADTPGGRNTHLFKIGTSVITNMQINFDPQSTVGFHSDGVPVQTDLTLTFQEIELQISPDNITGQDIQGLADAVSQNQSSSQTTSEQQAAQEAALAQPRDTGGSRQNRARDF